MTNNILEMKKHQHIIGRPPKTLGIDAIKEEENFNRFMWRYLSYLFVFVFGLGVGLWVADVYACGEQEKPMEPIKIVRGI